MTLGDLTADYCAAARPVRARLRELRIAYRAAAGVERLQLRVKITLYAQILTQLRDLADLCAHYYDEGYYRSPYYTLQEVTIYDPDLQRHSVAD